jgi:hypothetical protein
MALVLVSVGGPTAFAAAPTNDDFNTAVVISTLPFSTTLSTIEATTAADDPDCAGTGPTVWYRFTPTTNIRITANTFGSNYDTTLSVYTGTRGTLNQIACNDDFNSVQSQVTFDARAGVTYSFMVGAFASGPGGNLVFSVAEAPPLPPPLTIDVTIDRIDSVDRRTGVATIHGTVTCSREAAIQLSGDLREKVARINVIHGFAFSGTQCVGRTPWSLTVPSDNPNLIFTTGPASASVFASAFDPDRQEFVSDQATMAVQLTSGR